MTPAFLRFFAFGAALSLIAGCGGSSSGGTRTNSETITYNFGGSTPTAVAVKIGSGSFAPATISGGQLSFTLPDGMTDFAVAYACPGFSPTQGYTQNFEYLNYSSSLDSTSYVGGCPSTLPSGPGGGITPTATLTGTVDTGSFPNASELLIWALARTSGYGQGFNLRQGDDFSMSYVPPGSYAVVLMLYDSSWNALAVKSAGSQTVPGSVNDGSPVDFGAADATTLQPITYLNVPAGYSVPSTSVTVDAMGLSGPALLEMNGGLGIPSGSQNLLTQYSMLPASIGQSGDRYEIQSSTTEQLSSSTTSVVSVLANLTGGGPATITFPAPWSYAGPIPAALPAFDFSYPRIPGQSGLSYKGNLQWTPASGTEDMILISLTQNYQSTSPSVTVPDLSAIPGFLAPPVSGTQVSWRVSISAGLAAGLSTGSSLNAAAISSRTTPSVSSNPTSTSGSTVSNSGTYTVP